jgi:hypothetical protein
MKTRVMIRERPSVKQPVIERVRPTPGRVVKTYATTLAYFGVCDEEVYAFDGKQLMHDKSML